MSFIDMHCDTLHKLATNSELELFSNTLHVSIEKMQTGNILCQFFAMFVMLNKYASPDEAYDFVKQMYDVYVDQLLKNLPYICPALGADDIRHNQSIGKLSGVLALEEGGVLNGKIERLHELHAMGVRLITLTWNFENTLAYPNSEDSEIMRKPLKPFGVEVVEQMQELGMLVDVSHLNDGGFWNLIEICKKPIVASHSNARAITGVSRNLTDEMLKALANKGGVTGINFFHRFLGQDGTGCMDQIMHHMVHIKNVAGSDVLAFGSDFDGIEGDHEIENSAQYPRLRHAMAKHGFTQEEIDKICYKNVLRVMKDAM